MSDDQDTAIEELEGLLRIERQVLLQGAIAELGEMADRKQFLLQRLRGVETDRLAPLLRLAEENQRLIGAALRGIRAAQSRLSQIRRAIGGVGSYDKEGRARSIGSSHNSLERRA